jgi:catechol 2,3-dioxygenase-like lactoylglutathione lyase family enzyme
VKISIALLLCASLAWAQNPPQQLAHFHHVHLNVTDPAAAISFYTSKFDCEKASFSGTGAVWTQKSWLLFTKPAMPPNAEVTSAIWHIGWGAEDVPATYRQQLDAGTKFETPLTDISDLVGARQPGVFLYAYVDGPDHQLIELNTANHHRFGHIHMLSKDPVAAGEWYMKEFGIPRAGRGTPSREPRTYKGFQVGPSASLQMDNVNIIIFPMEYAKTQWPELWKDRSDFDSTRGHTVDHIAFGVDNLDETLTRLRKDGVSIAHVSLDGSNVHRVFIEGPDHVNIELVEGQPRKE